MMMLTCFFFFSLFLLGHHQKHLKMQKKFEYITRHDILNTFMYSFYNFKHIFYTFFCTIFFSNS